MSFLIVALGFLLAVRGGRPAPLQRPGEGLKHVLRENKDLFFTLILIFALWLTALGAPAVSAAVRNYEILVLGLAAYLLSRYQKKGDVFFLSVLAGAFAMNSKGLSLAEGVLWAAALSCGIAFFQGCFLGLRYRLLFSRVPAVAKGWPLLCLLACGIAMVLWRLEQGVF